MHTRLAVVLRSVVRALVLAVGIAGPPVAADAQTGIVVRGVASYGLDGWWGDMRLAHVTFSVQNNTTGSVTFTTQGEDYFAYGYVDEFGEWVDAPLSGTSSTAITLAAGQTTSVVYKLNLLYETQTGDIYLHLRNTAGVPVFDGRANVVGSASGIYARFYGETSTPKFTPNPKTVTVTATTTSTSVTLWNQGDGYLTATYALSTNCGALGVTCSVPSTVQLGPGSSGNINITFARGSFGAALPTFKVYATAPVNRYGVIERDSVPVSVTFGDVSPPSLWFDPASFVNQITGEETPALLSSRNTPVNVYACDSDGILGALTLTLNGVSVTPTTVATSVWSCANSKRATFLLPLLSGENTLVATVTDGVHITTTRETIEYDDAADHAASITALHPTPTVQVNRVVTDTFLVRNPGWHTVRYDSLRTSFCVLENPSGGCGGLVVRDSVTVTAGATVQVPVTYNAPLTFGRSERVTLRAVYVNSMQTTAAATGSFVATAAAMLTPTILVSPANGTTVGTSTTTLTVTWCDDDDAVVQKTVSLNGQDLGSGTDPGVGPTPNCFHEQRRRWTNLALSPWQQNAVVTTAVDQAGHSVSTTSTFAFTPAITDFAPEITPAAKPIRAARIGVTVADTFTVRNAGRYSATYQLSPKCPAEDCSVDRGTVTLAAGASADVVMSYRSPDVADVQDTIPLVALYTPPGGFGAAIADTAMSIVIAPSIQVPPAIGLPTGNVLLYPTYVGSWAFRITNHNTAPVTYALSWSTSGGFGFPNWFTPPSSVTVDAGQTGLVLIYSKAPAEDGMTGTYGLTASYVNTDGATLSASASAQTTTQAAHPSMLLAPNNTTVSASPGVQNQLAFDITSTGNTMLIIIPSVHCDGIVVNCRFHASPQYNVDVNSGLTSSILVDFDLDPSATVGSLRLIARDGQTVGAGTDSATVTVRRGGSYIALAVSPKTSYAVGLGRAVTQQFDVTNTGNTAGTVSLAFRCVGQALVCTPRDTSRMLGVSETASMTVTGYAANTAALSGNLLLIATAASPNIAVDTGRVSVTTASVAEVVVDARGASGGVTTVRERCLTIAAGDDGAYECGDLRLAHPLPVTTTMNKARAPTLVYNSRHQRGIVLFAADVRVAPGDTARSITAHVLIDGATRVDRSFVWDPQWNTGNARRIVVPVDAYALAVATGAHHYTFSVDVQSSQASTLGQDTGTVAIVNRATSDFGAGWWLDGLEQLIPYTATEKLWIGGDGSTRLYTRQTSGTWAVAPTVDRLDTLTTDGTFWYRWLPNRAYVTFDNAGRHVATVNASGHRTTFTYDAPGGRLGRIDLPVPAGSSTQRSYVFNYDANGVLASVDAPTGPNGARHVQISHAGIRSISAIRDPGAGAPDSVRFDFDELGRLFSRVNRRGDATFYRYESATHVLLADSISMQRTGEPPIVTTFCPAEAASIAACAPGPRDTAAVVTWVDGPRPDVNDTTRFHLSRFGSPVGITNALGQHTTISYGDAHWPALATAVKSPNGHLVESVYSARGLVDTTFDRKPLGGRDAVTLYTWNPVFDKPDVITTPEGVQTRFGYSGTGDRIWQEDGRGPISHVTFWYNADRQLDSILTPDNVATQRKDRYLYDALLGNLSRTTTAMGFTTDEYRDALGRDTLVVSEFAKTSLTYDLLDQTRTSVASEIGGEGKALAVQNDYDAEGNVTSVTRTVSPDPLHLGAIVIGSEYDAVGRKRREYDPNRSETGHWRYDAAGNVVEAGRGFGAAVTMEYDGLNRMKRRVVPNVSTATTTPNVFGSLTDDQRFEYDSETGNLKSATNFAARIGRTYYPNGSLASDTLRIASANLAESEVTRFSHHVYVLGYTYNLDGRRKTLTPPSGFGLTPVTYGYDTESGALNAVADGTFGAFTYAYTNGGLLDSLVQADGTRERHRYDSDGREIGRTEWNPRSGTLHQDDASLDSRGKKSSVASSGAGGGRTEFYWYDGLGAVSSTNGRTIESTPRDALGNVLERVRSGEDYAEVYTYVPHTTQLRFIAQQLDGNATIDSVEQVHNEVGDVARSLEAITGPAFCVTQFGLAPCQGPSAPRRVVAWSHLFNDYDAAGRLTLAVKETSNDDSGLWFSASVRDPNDVQVYPKIERGVTEEYRHDALGRRVFVRAHRNFYCPGVNDRDSTSVCISTIERTVYDGDQVLIEIRQPGDDSASVSTLESDGSAMGQPIQHFGTVGYLHGPSIDHPLALVRNYGGGFTPVVLHYQWVHGLDLSTLTDGTLMTPCTVPPCSGDQPDWVGRRITHGFVIPSPSLGPTSWWGTMANLKQNATGGLDMRNRVYDSRTGRFTQEDPIGLAGGLNLYGFGGGDAANYVDPFGFCGEKGGAPCPNQQGLSLEQQKALFDRVMKVNDLVSSLFLGSLMEAAAGAGLGAGEAVVANRVPATVARVIPAGLNPVTLAPVEAAEAFVTDAAAIQGLNYGELQSGLGIAGSRSGYEVITFSTRAAGSIASPVNRTNPLFVGGGHTVGGLPEFVIPNIRIPADATRTVIKP